MTSGVQWSDVEFHVGSCGKVSDLSHATFCTRLDAVPHDEPCTSRRQINLRPLKGEFHAFGFSREGTLTTVPFRSFFSELQWGAPTQYLARDVEAAGGQMPLFRGCIHTSREANLAFRQRPLDFHSRWNLRSVGAAEKITY